MHQSAAVCGAGDARCDCFAIGRQCAGRQEIKISTQTYRVQGRCKVELPILQHSVCCVSALTAPWSF
jgi:hypothetical protein